jgi:hypothetical protein
MNIPTVLWFWIANKSVPFSHRLTLTNVNSYMFSKIIYFLAVIDTILISVFFHKLSRLGEEALRKSPHIDFNFWVDYLVWIIITVLVPVYLHYAKHEVKSDIEKAFNLNNEMQLKIVTIIACDLLPLIILSAILFRVTKWLVLGTGPG